MQHSETPQVHFFIESFCALLCPEKCTTMRIFKCNSTLTSSALLILTSNAPSCASVYRSQSTTLGVLSNDPSVESSIAPTNASSSGPSSATSMGISGELLNLLENYLSDRYQRVVLNGQTSSWTPALAGVPQGSILGPLLFLMYINDLPNELQSNAKLFADDTSLFAVADDKNVCANILNNDLLTISKWAFNWKMLFNPDPKKPAQEVLFSRKKQVQIHPTISLNNVEVQRVPFQKHLGFILDEKLNFNQHIDSAISKINTGISVITN